MVVPESTASTQNEDSPLNHATLYSDTTMREYFRQLFEVADKNGDGVTHLPSSVSTLSLP